MMALSLIVFQFPHFVSLLDELFQRHFRSSKALSKFKVGDPESSSPIRLSSHAMLAALFLLDFLQ